MIDNSEVVPVDTVAPETPKDSAVSVDTTQAEQPAAQATVSE